MLTIFIFALIGVFTGWCFTRNREEVIEKVFGQFLCGLVMMLVGLGATIALREMSPMGIEIIEQDRQEIVNLSDSSVTRGSFGGNFMLIAGSVNQQEVYKFYVKEADGARVFKQLPAESVRVYEEDRVDAYVAKVYKKDVIKGKNQWLEWFIIQDKERFQSYAIHIPLESITSGYEIDMR